MLEIKTLLANGIHAYTLYINTRIHYAYARVYVIIQYTYTVYIWQFIPVYPIHICAHTCVPIHTLYMRAYMYIFTCIMRAYTYIAMYIACTQVHLYRSDTYWRAQFLHPKLNPKPSERERERESFGNDTPYSLLLLLGVYRSFFYLTPAGVQVIAR